MGTRLVKAGKFKFGLPDIVNQDNLGNVHKLSGTACKLFPESRSSSKLCIKDTPFSLSDVMELCDSINLRTCFNFVNIISSSRSVMKLLVSIRCTTLGGIDACGKDVNDPLFHPRRVMDVIFPNTGGSVAIPGQFDANKISSLWRLHREEGRVLNLGLSPMSSFFKLVAYLVMEDGISLRLHPLRLSVVRVDRYSLGFVGMEQ
mmetsp:Transcript_10951/g.16126  ORF Transcript_10951/g.16126 Transcript_10951/m.16126 type:complete len:203 (-) Transcript_10951:419-1027(-)